MTHRQRLLTSLNHKEPDRAPIDLASTQVTGISLTAYTNLQRYLVVPEQQPVICDRIQQIVIPDDAVYKLFGIDTRGLWPVMNHTDFIDQDEGDLLRHVDEWSFAYQRHKKTGLWYDLVKHPLDAELITADEVAAYRFPRGDEPRRISGLRKQAEHFRKSGYAVVLKSACAGLLEMFIRIRGMQNAMLDLLLNKKIAALILDGVLRYKLEYWDMALEELGDLVDVLAEGDDFGTQTSQLISLDSWRQMIKPRQQELIETMRREAPNAKVFFHSCGMIRPFLPEFIDMGIDIINPVHFTAAGMQPNKLKKDFGSEIVFWGGGVDTQDTLPHGTPEQVKQEVKRLLDVWAPNGGYVFNTVHNIQAEVPPENIVAMYEAVHEFF